MLTTIAKHLRERNQTLCTAESCTGGYIAHLITSVSGSSDYFVGGVVAYSDDVKENILGVKTETLKKHGAVSEQTVTEMAIGALTKFKTDYAIAVTGIAGPTGGKPDKPVGTVWIAIATTVKKGKVTSSVPLRESDSGMYREGAKANVRKVTLSGVEGRASVNLTTQKFLFGNNRQENIEKAANAALDMLRKEILDS